jgi:hypothetical protein
MSAVIEILGVRATVTNGKWTCEDPQTLKLLESLAGLMGDSPSIPDLDEALAQDATRAGANILQHSDKPATDDPDGIVY